MICPNCATELEMDPDGGYCPECDEYFPMDVLEEFLEENE